MLNIPTCEIEQIKLAKSTSDELYLKNLSNSFVIAALKPFTFHDINFIF